MQHLVTYTSTFANGTYSVTVPDGTYKVRFVPKIGSGLSSQWYNAKASYVAGDGVQMDAANRSGIDAALVP